jgi:hypothetical protein
MKPILLRKSTSAHESVTLWLEYDPACRMDPEAMLIEKDLLAPMFESIANPTYKIETSRIKAEFKSLTDALERYRELAANWKAKEVFKHPKIFRWVE